MILNVFDMKGSTTGLATGERLDDILGEILDQFSDARRSRTLAAIDRKKCLGHGH
jgi:hypothetical protein